MMTKAHKRAANAYRCCKYKKILLTQIEASKHNVKSNIQNTTKEKYYKKENVAILENTEIQYKCAANT